MKDGVLELADGRKLRYGMFGSSNGPPVMYCHGFPTNRFEFEIAEPFLQRNGVTARVVVLDRPGYGDSTFQAGRTLLDWPRDVAEAADRLGFEEFSVLGVSGGGPYALACAFALPDRVTRLGVVVGMGPADAVGMKESLTFRTTSGIGLVRRFQFGMLALGLQRGQDQKIFERSLANLGAVDRPVVKRPEMQEWFMRMLGESLKQGGRPAAHEAGLYLKRWGFDVADITVETHLWYGGADETVPASIGEWLADRIPNSIYTCWPEDGHFTWMASDKGAEVVAQISGTQFTER